ncbi:MAG TPA: hypothetical protein VK034_21965 [Enhygromyxa sp.]|nr:hypothetical protein [Enhygromyxa sp.]
MTSKRAASAAFLVVLASGCAAQHEESRNEAAPAAKPEYDAPLEEQVAAEPAAEPADDAEAGPRSLADIERELAANNAKLIDLGVELPGSRPADPKGGDTTGTKSTVTGTTGRSVSPSPAPDKPSTKPSGKPGKLEGEAKPSKRDKAGGKSKSKDELDSELGDGARPDAAKSAPRSPNDGGLDAAARCQLVCDLAAISCGLGDQICELADRHPDDPEYASACERANADCDAAKGACDACVE